MTIVYTRSDILISRILNISRFDVGNYGIACRMIEAILLFAAPIGMVLLRKFHLAELETEKLLRVFGRYVVYAAVVGIGFGVLGVFFSKTLIPVVFGHDYDSAGHLLSILFGGLAFALVNVVLNQAAIAISAERLVVIAISAGAIFNVVLNAVLMPSYGVEAAAWVAVVTQALIAVCLGYSLIKWLRCQVQVQDRKAS
jgi:O-antigen/teichoic acid export membrane protein